MKTVSAVKVVSSAEAAGVQFSPRVTEALGDLVGAAKEGLLALSVGVGFGVMESLMAEEVEELCGPRGRHDPARIAYRHGTEPGSVTLGGRRVPVTKPRVRAKDDGGEVPLSSYRHFAARDPLTAVVLERMLAGVSTRRYPRLHEPIGSEVEADSSSASKSAVSRTFKARTKQELSDLMSRRLDDVRLAVLMLDGIDLKGRTNVVALGISTDGVKIPLGLWEGDSENKTVASALLADLVDRGLDTEQGVLVVLDGAKALRAAVRKVLGDRTPVQRCIRHKERNVLDHLPEELRDTVQRRLRGAWALTNYDQALDRLQRLAGELEHSHPGAAASLREGMEETLTVIKLGITGKLKQTIESTNPCESMIECIRRSARNVKNWSSGEMAMRWTAAGMLEAEKQFRRVKGHSEFADLAVAVERHLNPPQPKPATSPQTDMVTV